MGSNTFKIYRVLTRSVVDAIVNLMTSFLKLLVVSFVLVFALVTSVFAQSPSPVVPTPEPGFNQSDFAKDVSGGIQAIKNDNDGQNNQNEIDENEFDEGQQENENTNVDEQIDQDEAQENQEDDQEEVNGNENGKNTTIQDEGNLGKQGEGSDSNNK